MPDIANSDVMEELRAHPFFSGFETEDLEKLTGTVQGIVAFESDEVIFRAGNEAKRCFLVRQGEIALEVHSPGAGSRIIQTVSRGEVLGWSWLFPPYRWAFDARVLNPTEAFVLDGEALRNCMDEDRDLGYRMMTRFAGLIAARLQATRLQLLDLYASRN